MATLKSLLVKVGADTSGLNKGMDAAEKKTTSTMKLIGSAVAAISFAVIIRQVAQFTKEATKLAARVETLGVVTEQLGKNAGYSANQIHKLEKSIQDQGITTQASRQALAKMMQAQLDLADATDLARLAQDAAVIAGTNSSEAFTRLINVIATGNVRMARTMGLQVDFNKGYQKLAKQLGKVTDDLTAKEKAQSRASSVMEQATQIAGTYEAAMDTVGKQLESTPRYIEEFTRALGQKFIPALGLANLAFQKFLKSSTEILLLQERLDEGFEDTGVELLKSAKTYEKYDKAMIDALLVARKLSLQEANDLKNRRKLAAQLGYLERKHGELTEAKVQALILTGDMTVAEAANALQLAEQVGHLERSAAGMGLLTEFGWSAARAIEGITEAALAGDPELKHFNKILEAQSGLVGDLANAFKNLQEKELRTLQVEAILAGDYALATSIGEKILAIEAQEAALQDLIDLLDELDGKVISYDVIQKGGGGGALDVLQGKPGGKKGTIEAFGQTFHNAEIKNGQLFVRGQLFSTQKVPGGARGADFTVPAGYPNDSYPMMVQSGEHVRVTPVGGNANRDLIDAIGQISGGSGGIDLPALANLLRDSILQVME